MIIRHATTNDIASLTALLTELFSIEQDFISDENTQQKGLSLLLECPETAAIFVAEQNSRVIGMCTAQLLISTVQGAPTGLIEDMVITRKHRGQGIGRKLLNTTVQWCQEKGATRVQLLADKTNQPALDFYKRENWDSTSMIALRKVI